MPKRDEPPLEGDPERLAELAATEQRLGVRLPDSYREFVTNPSRYTVMNKHVEFLPLAGVHWLSDDVRDTVIIGRTFTALAGQLVFKAKSGAATISSDAVFELADETFNRLPGFSEFVAREPTPVSLSADARGRLAERLAGMTRRCSRCAAELKVGQTCACGHIGVVADPKYVLTPEEQQSAQREHPGLWRAWAALSALKQAGHGVPAGPIQVLALADVLERTADAKEAARSMLSAWSAKGMKVQVDESTVAEAIDRAGVPLQPL